MTKAAPRSREARAVDADRQRPWAPIAQRRWSTLVEARVRFRRRAVPEDAMRMLLGSGSTVLLLGAALCACGNTVEPGGNGGGGSGASGTGASGTGASGAGSSGGFGPMGDCETPADCGGAPCIELTPGGWKVCASSPPEATACSSGPIDDECCVSSDCATGACYSFTTLPYCGGVQPAEYNVCVSDACSSDAECGGSPPGLCAPPGAFGNPVRGCLVAYCKTSADCTNAPGGVCAPIANPCCATPMGMACVYPGGCKGDADCSSDGSMHCEIDAASGATVCIEGGVGCPA